MFRSTSRRTRWLLAALVALTSTFTSMQAMAPLTAHAAVLWTGQTSPSSGAPNWWQFTSIPLNRFLSLRVNVANGNLLATMNLPSVPGVNGLNGQFSFTYNSFNRSYSTDMGNGWSMNMARDVGLDLSNPSAPVFHDPSGYEATFTLNGSTYTPPAGIDAQLVKNGDGTYTLTYNQSGSQLNFDATGFLATIQNRQGNQIKFGYDSSRNPTAVANTEGQTFGIVTSGGLVTEVTYQYDWATFTYGGPSGTDLTSVTMPEGNSWAVTNFYYDSNNQLNEIIDPLGRITLFAYVNGGAGPAVVAVRRVTDPSTNTGPQWYFGYSSGSTQVYDTNGHMTNYVYDSAGRVTSVTDPDGYTISTGWNADNHVTSVASPQNEMTTFTYDSLNNLTKTTLPNGETTSAVYQVSGQPYLPSSRTDAQGNTTTYTYTSNGLPWQTTVGNVVTHTYTYNSDGTLYRSSTPSGTTQYAYNSLGLLATETPPSPAGAINYTYGSNDLVSARTDSNGTTQYTYDQYNDVTQVAPPNTTAQTTAFDLDGEETSLVDSTGTTSFTYNLLGQQTQKTLPGNQTVSYNMDAMENLLSKTDSGGTTNYTYDLSNRLLSMTDPQGAKTTFSYDGDGRLQTTAYPNGVSEQRTYDAAGQLTQIEGIAAGGSLPETYSYSYVQPNSNGKVTSLRYSMTQVPDVTTYTYDAQNRLTGAVVKQNGATLHSYAYTYNLAGDLTKSVADNVTNTMTYNAADELSARNGVLYSYDGNGNRLSDADGRTLSYNGLNQTVSITPASGPAISQTYTGPDQTERTGSGPTSYAYDRGGLRSSTTSSATSYFNRTPDGTLVSERVNGSTYYYVFDGLGSVTGLYDSSLSEVNSYVYDPLGNTTKAVEGVSSPFRYISAVWDAATGLYKVGARFYDPAVGSFTQPDPASCLQSANPYSYASDDPINRTDVTGLSDLPVADAGVPYDINACLECLVVNTVTSSVLVMLGCALTGPLTGVCVALAVVFGFLAAWPICVSAGFCRAFNQDAVYEAFMEHVHGGEYRYDTSL